MKKPVIISDFDGVIGNSLALCLKVTQQITDLFDAKARIRTFDDYRQYLGKNSCLPSLTTGDERALRELHRLLMRRYATHIPVFNEVLSVYQRLQHKPLIASSAYAGTITAALGKRCNLFAAIHGSESQSKEETLANLKAQMDCIYVTDTKTDIKRCQSLGIPVVATVWGYDERSTLESAQPDYLVNTPTELAHLFYQLKLNN